MVTSLQTIFPSIALPTTVKIETGAGGIPLLHVNNPLASAQISLLGATVLAYQPHTSKPVLWVSSQSQYKLGTGIRGGIPVCWPWFGVHSQPGFPNHGFVKGMLWNILSVKEQAGETYIELGIDSTLTHSQYWAPDCALRLSIRIGSQLEIHLTTFNQSQHPFVYSAALHSYFQISNVNNTHIRGLENISYLCKMRNNQGFIDADSLALNQPVNRVYLNPPPTCYIEDMGYQRRVIVSKSGNHTTVVWNPSVEWCANQMDMLPSERFQMVCVESVLAPHEEKTILPGQSHTFSAGIQVENL